MSVQEGRFFICPEGRLNQRFSSLQPTRDLPQLQAILASNQPSEERQKRGWYEIRNASQSEAEIWLYDYVGEFGITAADFVRDLNEIKAPRITMRINSPGGMVFDSLAIFNAIRRHPATVTSYVDGVAASCASWIALAADVVQMSPHSQMMIHEAAGLCIGPANDMRQVANFLDKASDNIARIYMEKAGGSVEEWRARMSNETWFSDQEAVDVGLADGIDGAEPTNKLPNYDWTAVLNAASRSKPETPDFNLVGAISTGLSRGG